MPHSLEIVDGKLYSSGDNGLGQLGVGSNKLVVGKALVLTNTDKDNLPWINCKAGRFHSVAVKSDGSIWVWGDNRFGQLAQPNDVQVSLSPIQLNFPTLDSTKTIEIVTGYYFTIIYQYFDKAYGFGEFENVGSDSAFQYRQITPIESSNITNKWLSIQAGPKTIVGANVITGYHYTDWSGELFSKQYRQFQTLKIGDLFTLYDPGNRDRVLYKKVNPFSKGRGCCEVNAVCLFRTYRELISAIPPNIIVNNASIGIFDILDPESRAKIAKPLLTVREKYDADFVFRSAFSSNAAYASKYKGIDPWTQQSLFLMTDTDNMLDVILYDSLFFSDDNTQPLNQETVVELILAKEIFETYSKFDLPPYLLKRSNMVVEPSDFVDGMDGLSVAKDSYWEGNYNMDNRKYKCLPFSHSSKYADFYIFKSIYLFNNTKSQTNKYFTFRSRYGYKFFPLLYHPETKELIGLDGPKEPYYDQKSPDGFPGCPYYESKPKYIREIELEDKYYDRPIQTYIVGLPIDKNGQIMSTKKMLTDPYLLRYSIKTQDSSFKQGFMDPTYRITTKYNGNLDSPVADAWGDPMMFYTLVPDPTYNGIAASPPMIQVFYVGEVSNRLLELLSNEKTPAREVYNNFGINKSTLSYMWSLIKKASYPYKQEEKLAFAKLAGLIYNKLKDQPIIDMFGQDVIATGMSTSSADALFNFPYYLWTRYIGQRPSEFFSESSSFLPYQGVGCVTDRDDKSQLIIFGNYIQSFQLGPTLIQYETWSGDDKKTKAGGDVQVVSPQGGVSIAKDAYIQHTVSINVLSVSYDPYEFRTIVQLDKPFNNNYLLGNLLWGKDIRYQAMPFIHFNYKDSIIQQLQSIKSPLA